jgi:hypothetical protein
MPGKYGACLKFVQDIAKAAIGVCPMAVAEGGGMEGEDSAQDVSGGMGHDLQGGGIQAGHLPDVSLTGPR